MIISSYHTKPGKGLPIGNVTSQLWTNIYMNAFDQFMKHTLKVKHYIRYTDDFIIVDNSAEKLQLLLPAIKQYLHNDLKLALHPNKVSIRKYTQGIDFLGYVLLPHYRRLRTNTKQRMKRTIDRRITLYKQQVATKESLHQTLQSYLGVLSHADTYQLSQSVINRYWLHTSTL
jgi:hypothetical protein